MVSHINVFIRYPCSVKKQIDSESNSHNINESIEIQTENSTLLTPEESNDSSMCFAENEQQLEEDPISIDEGCFYQNLDNDQEETMFDGEADIQEHESIVSEEDVIYEGVDDEKIYDSEGLSDIDSIEDSRRLYNVEETLEVLMGVEATDYVDVPVSVLGLSVRPSNCLHSRVKSVAEILTKRPDFFAKIPHMGIKSVNEIIRKVRRYVSIPRNIVTRTQLDSRETTHPIGLKKIEPGFRMLVEEFLQEEGTFPNEGLNAQQDLLRERLIKAVEIVGKEVCRQAYYDSAYCCVLLKTLVEFAAPYNVYTQTIDELNNSIHSLPERVRRLNLKLLLRAFSFRKRELIYGWIPLCEDNWTIEEIPALCNRIWEKGDFFLLKAELKRFVTWLDFDVLSIVAKLLSEIKIAMDKSNGRYYEVFDLRKKGKTLEEVGNVFGVTRERIRQIEKRAHIVVWQVYKKQQYDVVLLWHALNNGISVLCYNDLRSFAGDEFAEVLWFCMKALKGGGTYYYSKTLDAIVIRSSGREDEYEAELVSAIDKLVSTLPKLIEEEKREGIINELASSYALPADMISSAFNSFYNHYGRFYYYGRITVGFMCDYVLRRFFETGYKIADEYDSKRFKQCLIEMFGSVAETITSRSIDARVTEIGVLCDRGKYIHKDYLQVDQSVIDAVIDYIEQSPRLFLPYGEIFEDLKGVFADTQITNRFLLQGALKKYGRKYEMGRDFIRKAQSVTFVDELESFVEERGVVHKKEILAEFTSLSDVGLGQVVARSANVFNIDNGY